MENRLNESKVAKFDDTRLIERVRLFFMNILQLHEF